MTVDELEQEAVRLTQSMEDALMAGLTPVISEEDEAGPLTREAGFDLATSVPKGMYVVESE